MESNLSEKAPKVCSLEPEKDDGNIEYKLKLVGTSDERLEQLSTQLRYRVDEGNGEAIYVIGVSDSGTMVGLDEEEFTESFKNLSLAAKPNNYSLTSLSDQQVEGTSGKKVHEILVREKNDNKYIDIKIAITGAVDAGKSSLLATLISGKKDNGRGCARLFVFNFKHEVRSGRTSSIAQHILGFDEKGNITNYKSGVKELQKKSWPEIVKDSSKIISFFDLCGHEKYLKTTILGLSSSFPDLCFVLVGANMGITRITQEHIFLCITLGIPFVIIISKIDICKNRLNILQETVGKINKLLKMPGLRRVPYKVVTSEDVMLCAKNVYSQSVVPIFHVSNVTGQGIDNLKHFLNILGKNKDNIEINNNDSKEEEKKNVVEYHIDTTFYVQHIGCVTGGQLVSGRISIGDKLILGPNEGTYRTVQVRGIHCKRVPLQSVNYGSYVCLALKKIDRNSIHRGNVLLSEMSLHVAVIEFDANITVLKAHSTTIKPGYEPVVHSSAMRQTARVISITNKIDARNRSRHPNDGILRTGDKATVRFRFCHHPVFLKKGDRVLMSEGFTKIVGIITDIFQ